MTRELVESPRFKRSRGKFADRDLRRQECIAETLLLMGANVFTPKLKTHPLTGRLEGFYACSCGYDCRILFTIVKEPRTRRELILLHDIGTHEEAY